MGLGNINYENYIKYRNGLNRQKDENKILDWTPDYSYAVASMLGTLDKNNNGHSGDIGKLPNHPTFSNESAFSGNTVVGGEWGKDGSWYRPSIDMVMDREGASTKGLGRYMKRVEPGVELKRTIPLSKKYFDKKVK